MLKFALDILVGATVLRRGVLLNFATDGDEAFETEAVLVFWVAFMRLVAGAADGGVLGDITRNLGRRLSPKCGR